MAMFVHLVRIQQDVIGLGVLVAHDQLGQIIAGGAAQEEQPVAHRRDRFHDSHFGSDIGHVRQQSGAAWDGGNHRAGVIVLRVCPGVELGARRFHPTVRIGDCLAEIRIGNAVDACRRRLVRGRQQDDQTAKRQARRDVPHRSLPPNAVYAAPIAGRSRQAKEAAPVYPVSNFTGLPVNDFTAFSRRPRRGAETSAVPCVDRVHARFDGVDCNDLRRPQLRLLR